MANWSERHRARREKTATQEAAAAAVVPPAWDAANAAVSIAPEHLVPVKERRDIVPELDQVDERIREGVTREMLAMLGKSGVNIDAADLGKALKQQGAARTELAGLHASLAAEISKGDFTKVIADFIELGRTKDGGAVSADNMFLDVLRAAGGSVESATAAELGKAADTAVDKKLDTSMVRIVGGEALVAGAVGLNIILFLVDTAIAKSILDYGLTSIAGYAGPGTRNGLSWFFAILSQGYLLYGKSRPEILNPKTTGGKANLVLFATIGLAAVGMLSAKIAGGKEQAGVAIEAAEQFKKNMGAVETGVAGFRTQVGSIRPAIEPLIKAKARAAAAEGSRANTTDARSLNAQIAAAQRALDAANARLKQAPQNAQRQTAAKNAEAALAALRAQKERAARPVPAEGADPEPNGPKSYTAWRVTYGLNHQIGGRTVKAFSEQPGFPADFGGFTVAKTEEAMAEIEKEFGLQPGEGMIAFLERLNVEVETIDLKGLIAQKEKFAELIEALRPNEWRYVFGPLYSIAIEWDLKAALRGEVSVEDLFAQQPELLKVATSIARTVARLKVQQDLERFQQRVKERVGLDLGIVFPEIRLDLTEARVQGWEVKRDAFAHVLDRTTAYYLTRLSKKDLPTIAGVLAVFFGGLFVVMGAKRGRSRLREDNLSGYEKQEFAREEEVAKALVDDLARREKSLQAKLEDVFAKTPTVVVNGAQISISAHQAPVPRSDERLGFIIRRGMRIAALKELAKPEGMSDEEFMEMKRAFVERRPRRGVFVKERSARAHLGSVELARAYRTSLDRWIRDLAGADRANALRAIRAEVTAFDGADSDRDASLDRLEKALTQRQYSAGQAQDLYDAMDAPFRKAEASAALSRVRDLSVQRDALKAAGAGRTVVLDGTDALTAKDLLYTDMLGEVEVDLDYYADLYKAISGSDQELSSALAEGQTMSQEARAEYARRLEEVFGSERQDAWDGRVLSEVVEANSAILKSVGARATQVLAVRAKNALGIPSDAPYDVRFEFPYDNAYSGRLLEINVYDQQGDEVASLTYPERIPNPTLDSDEKILNALERFLGDDSPELQVAKGEAKLVKTNDAIVTILGTLPADIDSYSVDADTLGRIDELMLRRDIAAEQELALQALRDRKRLSSQQQLLLGDAPENAQFSRFWRGGTRAAIDRLVARYPGKAVFVRPAEEVLEVRDGDRVEASVRIREA